MNYTMSVGKIKAEIESRLARLDYELSQRDKYDYAVVNDSLEGALARLEEILDGEKNR